MSGSDDIDVERFGRHLPRILEKQIIANLANQFVRESSLGTSSSAEFEFSSQPSIAHFHGCLLFVDISGFTVLSQRLHVDELRIHINAYFKRILDCIERHGGDCIKFAGDALFVVWQTETNNKDNEDISFEDKARRVVERAMRCGIEINATCSNYRIALKPNNIHSNNNSGDNNHNARGERGSNVSNLVLSPSNANGTSTPDVEYTFLNVHSGLSVGHITGIDVGHMDRWEYLIIGEPLHDVAKAEADAGVGEICISSDCHTLLCQGPLLNPHNGHYEDKEELKEELPPGFFFGPCGCCVTPSGCFKISEQKVPKLAHLVNPDEEDDMDREMAFYESVVTNATSAFEAIKAKALQKFRLDTNITMPMINEEDLGGIGNKSESNKNGSNNLVATLSPRGTSNAPVQYDLNEVIFNFYLRWVTECLRDDFARHVHEADRVDVKLKNMSRFHCLENCAQDFASSLIPHNKGSSSASESHHRRSGSGSSATTRATSSTSSSNVSSEASSHHSSGASRHHGSGSSHGSHGNSFVSKIRGLASSSSTGKDRSKAKHNRTLRNDGGLTGEQRKVIVLFVSIYGEPTQVSDYQSTLSVEDSNINEYTQSSKKIKAQALQQSPVVPEFTAPACFNFADSNNKTLEDALILNHYQRCMEVLVAALKSKGGQLRQFIVDDKGKVAIGTFGLRGSVAYDNAAAAVEAGQMIMKGLQAMGLNAAIGIAAGLAYCGIVGSLRRHEYAVMGPNVNLSARLMGKAGAGNIIADENIRNGDRVHHFQPSGSVQAKGFAQLINVYTPIKSRASSTFEDHLLGPAINTRTSSTSSNLAVAKTNVIRLSSDGNSVKSNEQQRLLSIRKSRLYGREDIERKVLDFVVKSWLILESSSSSSAKKNNSKGLSSSLIAEPAEQVQDELLAKLGALPGQMQGDIEGEVDYKPSAAKIEKKKSTFHHEQSAKIVFVKGESGLGKSAFLQLISSHLEVDFSFAGANIDVFHGSCSSLNSVEPFKSWRSIVRQMLVRYSKLDPSFKPTAKRESDRLQEKWHAGLNYLQKKIGADCHDYLPLLSSAQLVPGLVDTEATKKMSTAEKLTKLNCVLQYLVGMYSEITGRVSFIVMDDSHFADSHSLKLLRDVWINGKGLVILSSWSSTMTDPKTIADMSETIQTNMKELDEFAVCNRVIKIHLENLDLNAIKGMATAAFLHENIVTNDEEVFTCIEKITGGNPLYVYEITKAIVDKYKQMRGHYGSHQMNTIEEDNQNTSSCEEKTTAVAQLPTASADDDEQQSNLLVDILNSFRGGRVEEVIFYRYDRLEQKSQLILKMGSVASASNAGRGFSLDMLCFMFKGTDVNNKKQRATSIFGEFFEEMVEVFYDDSAEKKEVSKNLAKLIKHLLSSGEFLTTVRNSHRNSITEKSISAPVDGDNDNNADAVVAAGDDEAEPNPHQASSMGEIAAAIDLDHLPTNESFKTTDSVDNSILIEMQEVDFDFKITMERSTIYDLLLAEQRESLHDRVATFLETANEKRRERGTLSSNDLNEEAFHWEQAKIYDNALRCYYQASMILNDLGAYKESYKQLKSAYACYVHLREESGGTQLVNRQLDAQTYGDILKHVRSLSSPQQGTTSAHHGDDDKSIITTMTSAPDVIAHNNDCNDPTASALDKLREMIAKKKVLFRIFDGDSTILQSTVDMIVRFAQASFTLREGIHVTERLYEEALQIIYIAWKMEGHCHETWKKLLDNNAAVEDNNNGNRSGQSTAREAVVDVDELANFGLLNPEVAFPILSGIAAMYRLKQLQDDEHHTKEYTMYELMKGLAQTSPDFEIHKVQSKCLMKAAMSEALRDDEAIEITDQMMKLYDFEKHSAKLIKAYGNDRAGYTMSLTLQTLIAMGKMEKAQVYIHHIWAIMVKMQKTHLHSLGTIAHPLSTAMVMLGRVKDAQAVFDMYYETETARGPEVYSFFRPVNPLYHDWFAMQMLCQQQGLVQGGKVTDCLEPSELQERMINKQYYHEDPANQPFLHAVMIAFGVGVEFVCGDVLSFIAMSWMRWLCTMDSEGNNSNEQYQIKRATIVVEAERVLAIALDYLNLSIKLYEAGGSSALVNVIMTLLCKAKVIMMMEKLKQIAAQQSSSPYCQSPELKEAVMAFCEIGRKHKLHYCCFFAAIILEQVVDKEAGSALRSELAENVQMEIPTEMIEDKDLLQTFLPSFVM